MKQPSAKVALNQIFAGKLFVAMLFLCAIGCATSPTEPNQSPEATGPTASPPQPTRPRLDAATRDSLNQLLPAEALPGQFVIQQEVTVRWSTPEGPGEATFEAALQRNGTSLLLLGFGPMNRVGFELGLEDGQVRFENRTGRDMPFRPEDILADVQRVFYPWIQSENRDIGEVNSPLACTDCSRRGERFGLEIEETFRNGRLTTRSFRRIDRPDLGSVKLAYSGPSPFGQANSACEVHNEWFGYDLSIKNRRMDVIKPSHR